MRPRMRRSTFTVPAFASLLTVALIGCGPQPIKSQIAGQWRGPILSTTTRPVRHNSVRVDQYRLTILEDGRFAIGGLAPTQRITYAGQTFTQGRLTFRIIDLEYTPTTSRVTLTFQGRAEADGPVLRGGETRQARLAEDGRLEYRFFGYAMTVGDPDQSSALSHHGMLQRVETSKSPAPTTQPREPTHGG